MRNRLQALDASLPRLFRHHFRRLAIADYTRWSDRRPQRVSNLLRAGMA